MRSCMSPEMLPSSTHPYDDPHGMGFHKFWELMPPIELCDGIAWSARGPDRDLVAEHWLEAVEHWWLGVRGSHVGFIGLLKPKPGIDRRLAMRHIDTIAFSMQPSHEVKINAIALLARAWFEAPEVWP